MILRIAVLMILVLGSVSLPLVATLLIFVTAVGFFHKFWEGNFVGVVLDSLYFSPLFFLKIHIGFFTVGCIVLYFLMQKIKFSVQTENFVSKLAVAGCGGLLFYFLLFLFY